jgi:DNA-binding CsgD family transcriptional regulator
VIGRREPLDRLAAVLEGARRGTAGALVLVGEAGIGKTSLLDHVHAAAEGFLRLRVRGIESEAALDHAALLQLLTPLRHHLEDLPEPQRRAVAAAVGWGPRRAGDDRFLVAAGTMSLLAAAAGTGPVLVVVDDLHWLDPGTAMAVLFAARRLAHDGVALILATRGPSPPGTAIDGLELLRLEGLSPTEAAALLPTGIAEAVVEHLVASTGGNPLALLETSRGLDVAQRRGAAPLPDLLPAGDRLEAVFRPVVTGLSPAGRRAVTLAAASRDGAIGPIAAALRAEDLDPDEALEEAEVADVLHRDPGTVRFRHPLLRSAVWSETPPVERRAAYRALAEALPASQRRTRTWYLAEATTAPDADLARELDAMADEDREHFGHAAASAALERAARLSVDPTDAAERLAAAIEDAAAAGEVERARGLAAQVLGSGAPDAARGRVLASLGILEQVSGSVRRAVPLLAEAAELTRGRLLARVRYELAVAHFMLGEYDQVVAVGAQAAMDASDDDAQSRFLADWVQGLAAMVGGDPVTGRALLQGTLDRYIADPHLRDEPWNLVPMCLTGSFLDVTADVAGMVEDRLDHARRLGALAALVPALGMWAYGRAWLLGDHTGAFALAGEAVELGTELGFVVDVAPPLELLAWQHAARGAHDEARTDLDRAADLVARAGTSDVAAHLVLARAFCALCRDDVDEVVVLLEPWLDIGQGRGANGDVLGVAPLLVEAYAALGRTEDADRLAARFAAIPGQNLRTTALAHRCRGLATPDDDEATAAYLDAIAAHEEGNDDRFELARTELLLGARLRRAGRRRSSREHLRRARDRFDAMDLTLWTRRAAAELAATGETARSRKPVAEEPLTSQEARVAVLVGQGLTNREVAAALFVSPKTVEYHLSNVYRKRGLRSRSELARTMATAAIPEHD